jgi:hypothetical protein
MEFRIDYQVEIQNNAPNKIFCQLKNLLLYIIAQGLSIFQIFLWFVTFRCRKTERLENRKTERINITTHTE